MTVAREEPATARLFTEGRTYSAWQPVQISDGTIEQLYDLLKFGPTSVNCSPGRFVFVRTPEGKAKLAPAMSKGNLEKTMSAPVTVIVAYDRLFLDQLPRLFPHANARSWFLGNADFIEETALRNGSLQAAYLILAARMLGLDAGPMSGFDRDKVDATFLAGTSWRSNVLVNLGVGNPLSLRPRLPRLDFNEACRLS